MADGANIARHLALMAARAPRQCALKIPHGRTPAGDVDYLAFGVRYIWVLDPEIKKAYVYSGGGMHAMEDGTPSVEGSSVEIPLSEVFD